MYPVELRDLTREQIEYAAPLAARGFRDNPIEMAIFGDDPVRRHRALIHGFRAHMYSMPQPPLGAWRGDQLVGVVGAAPPGECSRPIHKHVKVVRHVAGLRPREIVRSVKLYGDFERHDLPERHWHVTPVVVEPGLHGFGIGSRMLEEFGRRMDTAGEVAFLETDLPENVRLYERFGFEVVDEAQTLGVTAWFMRRPPNAAVVSG